MATVSAVIVKRERKSDGTWNVKIRVTHKGPAKYIPTEHFVSAIHLTKSKKLKDPFIISQADIILSSYRKEISSMGAQALDRMTSTELRDHLKNLGSNDLNDDRINFIDFAETYISELRSKGKDGSAGNYRIVKNSLIDYFETREVYANDINVNMLKKYEVYLRNERIHVRPNQLGGTTTTTRKGLSDSGIHGHMRDLRGLFNAARDHFNDEDLGIIKIPNYPFSKFKVGSPPVRLKRNLTIPDLIKIRDIEVEPDSRAELAKDLFMLSFYLCGMNAKDIFLQKRYNKGRIDYNRSKTEGKRKDKAFISIHIPEEAIPLAKKYFGKLQRRYSNVGGLNQALHEGFKTISKLLPEVQEKLHRQLSMYFARHTFANEARNTCRFSKDDVALALNHVDNTNSVTDLYIERSWKIVDEVQKGVINLIRELDQVD